MTTEALDWSHRVTEIPQGGLRETREANPSERVRLAEALEIISCQRLVTEFTIRAIGRGHYRLAGKLMAEVTQACVVTLEPVAGRAEGEFEVEYRPAGTLPTGTEEEIEVLSAPEVEPIEHGRIDVGRIVFETLSASIDPYPRKPGAAFEPIEEAPKSGVSPFVVLKKLKDQ